MAAKTNTLSKTFVWIILALLIVGLAGFGATNLSGTVRSVGAVGDKDIDVDAYARALQSELRALQAETGQTITFQQAQSFGLTDQVLRQLVTTRALDAEADRLGLSIGDENLRDELMAVPAFQSPAGGFDREAYRFSLENAGMSEAQFEAQLREEAARTMLQAAIVGGNAMPDTYAETMVDHLAERRGFTWAALDASALQEPVPVPDEAALEAFHEENIADYTRPEARAITYAWLTPEMILDSVEVDDAALESAYAEREAEFNQPERRLVERLAFADAEAADGAKAQLEVGGTSFDALVEARGLELGDVDLGDLARDEMGAAGDAVFAAEVGDVVGPFETPLGPALFRVNGILAAQETPFDDARETLVEELAADRARRVIETGAENIADLLAGGATLENLAEETDMQLDRIDWYQGVDRDIAAYQAFREAAQAVAEGDFPEVAALGDGGIFAIRLDEIKSPEPRPYAEVADRVAEDWRAAQTRAALRARAQTLAPQVADEGGFAAAGLAPMAEEARLRSDFIDGAPRAMVERAFAMQPGETAIVEDETGVALLRLDDVAPPDRENIDIVQLGQRLADQAGSQVSQDLFQALARDIQNRVGIELNEQALSAVHAQFR